MPTLDRDDGATVTAPPPFSPKLLGRTSQKLWLALASVVVLASGALLAPRAMPTALSTGAERATPLLEAEVQRREPERLFRGVQDVASKVGGYGVAIDAPPNRQPATVRDYGSTKRVSAPVGFGVVVSPSGDVLTVSTPLAGRLSLAVQTPDGEARDAQVVAYDAQTGLSLLRLASPTPTGGPPVAMAPLELGALAVAVGHWTAQKIVVPIFVTSVGPEGYSITASDGSILPGTPIYNLDGELAAIATGSGPAGTALPVNDAMSQLIARADAGVGLTPAIGVALQPIDKRSSVVFGETGVIVNDVVPDGPADRAEIEAGDVLVSVGGIAVDSTDSAQAAIAQLTPGAETTVEIRRDSRERTVTVLVGSTYQIAAAARSAMSDRGGQDLGLVAETIFDPAELHAAGVPLRARVLRVNGRPVTSRNQALREIQRGGTIASVYLQHDDERFFAAIERSP